LLGAVLPDLATMARVRIDRASLPPAVADGVRCHVAADAAFHADRTFLAGVARLRTELSGAGLGRGPARAAGHVGWELLLDGTLVGSDVEAAFRRAVAAACEGVALDAVPHDGRGRWRTFLARWSAAPGRLRYDEPAWVADRVYSALADRPRLRMEAHDVPVLAAALDRRAADVVVAAPAVIAATTAAAAA
jgi:hypothetical protein